MWAKARPNQPPYTMHAKVARTEGMEQFAEIFLLTADNEREHASWMFKMIQELKRKAKKMLRK